MNEELRQLKEDYIREIIRFYREKGLSKESITVLDTLIHSAKNLCKLIEGSEEGYSMRWNEPYSYDNSYARGRGPYAHRDSMGRYSSTPNYSGHHDTEFINGLRDLMGRTTDEASRHELQSMIDRAEMR